MRVFRWCPVADAASRASPEVEGEILELLAESAIAPEQIAANLRVNEDDVRRKLEALCEQGFVELSAITQYNDMSTGGVLAHHRRRPRPPGAA
jgi:predicted ArsR family transcriptional regulator